MKKIIGVIFILLLSVSSIQAIDMDEGIQTLAKYAPADTPLFFSIRTDNQFINELDDVLQHVTNNLSLGITNLSLIELIDDILRTQGLEYASVRILLGNEFAMGVTNLNPLLDNNPFNDLDSGIFFAVDVQLSMVIDQVIADLRLDIIQERNGFTVYSGDDDLYLAVSDEVVVLSFVNDFQLDPATSLFETESFQNTISALPADSYNAMAYANIATLGSLGLTDVEDSSGFGVGLTIIEELALTVDFVFTSSQPSSSIPLDRPNDLLEFVPSGNELYVISAGFDNTYRQSFDDLGDLSQLLGSEITFADDIAAILSEAGIALEEDVLSWMDGNYAYIGSIKTLPLLTYYRTDQWTQVPYGFGLVVESTNPELTEDTYDRLSTQLAQIMASNDTWTTTNEQHGDWRSTHVTIQLPETTNVNEFIELEVVIAIDDDASHFVLLERDDFDSLLDGETLNMDDRFITASQEDFLLSSAGYTYVSSKGVTELLGVMTVLSSTIDPMVFAELANRDRSPLLPRRELDPSELLTVTDFFLFSEIIDSVIESASSSGYTDADEGVSVGRITLRLKP